LDEISGFLLKGSIPDQKMENRGAGIEKIDVKGKIDSDNQFYR
jgi:hypothetical protein